MRREKRETRPDGTQVWDIFDDDNNLVGTDEIPPSAAPADPEMTQALDVLDAIVTAGRAKPTLTVQATALAKIVKRLAEASDEIPT